MDGFPKVHFLNGQMLILYCINETVAKHDQVLLINSKLETTVILEHYNGRTTM